MLVILIFVHFENRALTYEGKFDHTMGVFLYDRKYFIKNKYFSYLFSDI